jgi:hypothetical protein
MFTLFNKLPPEICLLIWEATIPGSKIINIKERLVMKSKLECNGINTNVYSTSLRDAHNRISPSTMFACKEFRQVALKLYVTSSAFACSIPETYFDFSIDTLYLRFTSFAGIDTTDWLDNFIQQLEFLYNSDDFRQIRKLAILFDSDDNEDCDYQLDQVIIWLSNLGELTVTLDHFNQGDNDRGYIILIEHLDKTRTCHRHETFEPKNFRHQKIQDVLLAIVFVFTMEFESDLQQRCQRIATQDIEN